MTGRGEAAASLARELFADSARRTRGVAARRSDRVARLAGDTASMEFTLALTDHVGRIRDPRRAARRLADLVAEHGIPPFLGPVDKALLRGAATLGPVLPAPVGSLLRRRVRHEASAVVVTAGEGGLARHLRRRHRQGFDTTVNLLGEAILGHEEAARRLAGVLAHIRRVDVDHVSVKASAVCARLSSLAFERSVSRVQEVLAVLLRAAAAQRPAVLVNVDMEEYRDLELTLEAFRRVLDEPELAGSDAGVVLQAYLPDSHDAFEPLATWASDRFERTGGRTRVRIVKGANLAMERVDAELHGWLPATYPAKADVDASYKRLVARALDPQWGDGLVVGLASHNLFDVAWGLLVAADLGTAHRLQLEMLEGMAAAEADELRRRGHPVRLYTPVVDPAELDSAVAYLARRLDENSGSDNYLHHVLVDGRAGFESERARFLTAVELQDGLEVRSRRQQDRAGEVVTIDLAAPFANQADTDWTRSANRAWILDQLAHTSWPACVPLGAGGDGEETCGPSAASCDPSQPGKETYRWHQAAAAQVDAAVATARAASWRTSSTGAERAAVLVEAAGALAHRRGELIAAMVADAGKVVGEADVEVSEAVDHAAYYARAAIELDRRSARHAPIGTVVVAPPWNFPLAIALGGTLAALAAGNAVILKPAPETVLTAWVGACCLWDAGVPSDALQFVPCPDGDVGQRLISHPGVDAVILTGSYATARTFLDWRPDLHLLAETSGKNAIVVTAAADIDLAVADLVRSAFGHAGQKCSAASLAIVERTVLADRRFLYKLRDATRTLVVGPAADLATEVGPLIHPPSDALARALTSLEVGESWLVEPRPVDAHRQLWTPGVKTGVRPGSWFHHTECFGPVLGVMEARDLSHAIELQDAVPFGLTAGLQSLDPAEIRLWLSRVEAGNAYVNRPITGAIVGRQPFGGWKRSAVGPTAKAGGPGYVPSLCHWRDAAVDRLAAAEESYAAVWSRLGRPDDPAAMASEINALRHLPLPGVALWVGEGTDPVDVELCDLAAKTVGAPLLRYHADADDGGAALVAALLDRPGLRLRILGRCDEHIRRAAHDAAVTVDDRPPVADGDVELRRWTREQAVSITAHRYGHPIDRANLGL